MKVISFFISVLIHLLFIFLFFLIIKPVNTPIKNPPVYTVNLITIKNKPKPIIKKPKKIHKVQKQQKPKKLKPKRPKPKRKAEFTVQKTSKKKIKNKKLKKIHPKPKIQKRKSIKKVIKKKPKPNIKKKVELLKERILLNKIKEELLKEKIEMLKKHILSQEEAEREYKKKLAYNYINLIQGIIYSNWGVEKSIIQNRVLITKVDIKLDYSGNLIKLKIVKSSGNAYFDGTVINAIKSSAPFPKPPKDILSAGTVEFIITFDSREKK